MHDEVEDDLPALAAEPRCERKHRDEPDELEGEDDEHRVDAARADEHRCERERHDE
jgi:hypothetical protein